MATLTIDGFNRECECQHCGRPLKLGVTTVERGTIGADCFVRLIDRNTKRYSGNGKPSAERVKEYAIIATKGSDYAGRVHGLYGAWNVFELKAA
jgi:hypothetical protein